MQDFLQDDKYKEVDDIEEKLQTYKSNTSLYSNTLNSYYETRHDTSPIDSKYIHVYKCIVRVYTSLNYNIYTFVIMSVSSLNLSMLVHGHFYRLCFLRTTNMML